MGRYTDSIPVKFAAQISEQKEWNEDTIGLSINGWTHQDTAELIGSTRKHVLCHTFTRPWIDKSFEVNTYKVHAVNESEYSSVGEVYLTAFADNEDALKAFLDDFKYKAKIEKDTTVQQTI